MKKLPCPDRPEVGMLPFPLAVILWWWLTVTTLILSWRYFGGEWISYPTLTETVGLYLCLYCVLPFGIALWLALEEV